MCPPDYYDNGFMATRALGTHILLGPKHLEQLFTEERFGKECAPKLSMRFHLHAPKDCLENNFLTSKQQKLQNDC